MCFNVYLLYIFLVRKQKDSLCDVNLFLKGKWKISIVFYEWNTIKYNENKAVLLNSSSIVLPVKAEAQITPLFWDLFLFFFFNMWIFFFPVLDCLQIAAFCYILGFEQQDRIIWPGPLAYFYRDTNLKNSPHINGGVGPTGWLSPGAQIFDAW